MAEIGINSLCGSGDRGGIVEIDREVADIVSRFEPGCRLFAEYPVARA